MKINDNQNSFDPNYSTSAFGPEGIPDHNSPISSRLRFRPTPALSFDINLEYDVNFKPAAQPGLLAARGRRSASPCRPPGPCRTGSPRSPRSGRACATPCAGAGRFVVLRDRLILEGSTDYDFVRKELLQAHAKAQWNVQCCGFAVEHIRYNFNSRVERQWRLSVQLANVGDIGNFLGNDDRGPRSGGTRPTGEPAGA